MSVSMMIFTGVPHSEWEVRNNTDSIILSISNSFNVSLNPYLKLIIGSDQTPINPNATSLSIYPNKNQEWPQSDLIDTTLFVVPDNVIPEISVSEFVIPDVESDLETYQTCYP